MTINDEHLDRAIDSAVRHIMSADAPAGLRRRVLARLEGTAPARGGVFAWRPALAGVALVTVIAVGVAVMWRDDPSPARETGTMADARRTATPERVSPVAPPAAASGTALAEARGTGQRRPAAPPARPTRETIVMPPIADVFGKPTERVTATTVEREPVAARVDAPPSSDLAIAPLAPPPPITIAPLTTSPIIVPPIQIVPIDVRRIDLGPAPVVK